MNARLPASALLPSSSAAQHSGLLAQAITVQQHGRTLLDGIDLQLAAGQVGVLLGPNGAGKSTLLHVLGGLRSPQTGQIWLDGEALHRRNAAALARRRAFLPQELVPAFDFTAQEVVELGRYPHRLQPQPDEEQIVRAALEHCAVAHLAQRSIRELSGGERARVQLARTLAQVWCPSADGRSNWLLLDEPTAALDLQHQHACLNTLRQWSRQRGAGVLLVLHDLNLALRYADCCWVLQDGRLVGSGEPASVLQPELVHAVWQVHTHAVRDPSGVEQLLLAP